MKSDNLDLKQIYVQEVTKEIHFKRVRRERWMWLRVFENEFNPFTPNDLQRRRAVNPLKIKILSKNMLEKPTNTPIIHSVY
jgi:hypothetical protein